MENKIPEDHYENRIDRAMAGLAQESTKPEDKMEKIEELGTATENSSGASLYDVIVTVNSLIRAVNKLIESK